MSTVADVVTLSLKLAKIIPSGATPTADEAADGLICFQSMLDEWVANGMFGTLEDEYLEASNTAEEGKRYLLAAGVTLTYPTLITGQGGDYGDEGNTASRQVLDLSLVESVSSTGTRTVKLWDRTAWVALTGLALVDTAPLASRGLAGLAAALACSGAFAAMFDDSRVSPRVEGMSRRFLGSLSGKKGSTQATPSACYF